MWSWRSAAGPACLLLAMRVRERAPRSWTLVWLTGVLSGIRALVRCSCEVRVLRGQGVSVGWRLSNLDINQLITR